MTIIGGVMNELITEMAANIIVKVKEKDDSQRAVYILPRIEDSSLHRYFTDGVHGNLKRNSAFNRRVIFDYISDLKLYLNKRNINGITGSITQCGVVNFKVLFIHPDWDFRTVVIEPELVEACDVLRLDLAWKDPTAPLDPERFFFRQYPE